MTDYDDRPSVPVAVRCAVSDCTGIRASDVDLDHPLGEFAQAVVLQVVSSWSCLREPSMVSREVTPRHLIEFWEARA